MFVEDYLKEQRETVRSVLKRQSGTLRLVRLKVRTNSGVEVPIGQNTGCP